MCESTSLRYQNHIKHILLQVSTIPPQSPTKNKGRKNRTPTSATKSPVTEEVK